MGTSPAMCRWTTMLSIYSSVRTVGKLRMCLVYISSPLLACLLFRLLMDSVRASFSKTIKTHIEGGTTIICDRYYYSGIVYSAAKRNPTLSLDWARAPEVGLPRPDLVIFLDLD